MALRIRKDGRVFCAALTAEEPGDTYIDDAMHYHLSERFRVLVTYPMPKHAETGEWWWAGNAPDGVEAFGMRPVVEVGTSNVRRPVWPKWMKWRAR